MLIKMEWLPFAYLTTRNLFAQEVMKEKSEFGKLEAENLWLISRNIQAKWQRCKYSPMISMFFHLLETRLSYAGTWKVKRELLTKHREWEEWTASLLLQLTTISTSQLDKREKLPIGTSERHNQNRFLKVHLIEVKVTNLWASVYLITISTL